jgi:hypothetical protein
MQYAWVYFDMSKQVGDDDYVKIFTDADTAHAWFMVHDPGGVAFEYPIIRAQAGPAPLQPS